MVLEHLFPENWLEKKAGYAFLLAIVYSVIGIIAARLVFGSNSGIVSVVFVSILFLPTLQKIFGKEEKKEEKEKRFTFVHLWNDNKDLLRVYFSIFFGIFFTYMFFSFVLPQLGMDISNIFREQIFLDPGLMGHAYNWSSFAEILMNNWWVLLACFLLALFTGDGAIFFITWNASAWGAIFGYRALTAGWEAGANPWIYLFVLLTIVIWHVVLEGGAYIIAAISGGMISREIIRKTPDTMHFVGFMAMSGMIFFILLRFLRFIEMGAVTQFMFTAGGFLITLYFLKHAFKDKMHRNVFSYNYYLFIIAIVMFIFGVLIEVYVIGNSSTLNEIYSLSRSFFG